MGRQTCTDMDTSPALVRHAFRRHHANTSALNNINNNQHAFHGSSCDVISRHGSSCDVISRQDDGSPKFRGSMLMIQKVGRMERKLGVVLSIYATSFDLYAVVSQERNVIVKDCGYIRLKNCSVSTDAGTRTLEIVRGDCEGLALRFRAHDQQQLRDIVTLLHLTDEETHDELFSDAMTSSSSAASSPATHGSGSCGLTAVGKLRRSGSPVSSAASPRVSPNAKRKLSMPVLAEDDECEELEHYATSATVASSRTVTSSVSSLSLNESSCDSD